MVSPSVTQAIGSLTDVELPQPTSEGDCPLLPGYKFLHLLSRTSYSEVWKVRNPQNREKLARIIFGFANPEAQARWENTIPDYSGAHPNLLWTELVRSDPGRVILLTEPVERTLADRYQDCLRLGLGGLPREELIEYLCHVADALDLIYQRSRVQHLGLTPRHLLLDFDRILIADIGLAQYLTREEESGPIASRSRPSSSYASPEWALSHKPHPTSDQYSLALIYAELLAGRHPFRALTRERASRGRQNWKPDLSLLPIRDRDIVNRALQHDPSQRFPNCMAMLRALNAAVQEEKEKKGTVCSLPTVMLAPGRETEPRIMPAPLPTSQQLVRELYGHAVGTLRVQEYQKVRYILRPGEVLLHRCVARLPPGVELIKLEGFMNSWKAQTVYHDENLFVLKVAAVRKFLQALFGQESGLRVEVQLAKAPQHLTGLTEVSVAIKPYGCGSALAVQLLETMGPALLESLRSYLQALPEMRSQERLLLTHSMEVVPVLNDEQFASAIECQTKDISMSGIGLLMPKQPTTSRLYLCLETDLQPEPVGLLAKVVRVKPLMNGQYEVGALFAIGEERRNEAVRALAE